MNPEFPKIFFFPPAVVRYLNAYTGVVLLRCRKEFYHLVCSALPFITYLENKGHRYPCFLNTLHVGGTIRTCQKFLIHYNRRQLLILLQNCTDEGERQAIQKSVTRSCLLEERSDEEFSESGEEEAAEAVEWTSARCGGPEIQGPVVGTEHSGRQQHLLQFWQSGWLLTRGQGISSK